MRPFRFVLPALVALCLAPAGEGAEMLVHLPGAPSRSAEAVAQAADALGGWLDQSVPGLDLQVRIFRRWSDAAAYYREHAANVPLVLADPAFLRDLPDGQKRVPVAVFASEGETRRRLVVVVPAAAENKGRLADLHGARLAVPELAGAGLSGYLEDEIFRGEISPRDWFELQTREDELTATADALYGETEAALVGADNPLLLAHLPNDLRIVYTSPPVSLPVFAAPPDWDPGLRDGIRAALSRFPASPGADAAFAALGIDGFLPVDTVSRTSTRSAEGPVKVDALLLDLSDQVVPAPARPATGELPFTLGVVLPRIPISSDVESPP